VIYVLYNDGSFVLVKPLQIECHCSRQAASFYTAVSRGVVSWPKFRTIIERRPTFSDTLVRSGWYVTKIPPSCCISTLNLDVSFSIIQNKLEEIWYEFWSLSLITGLRKSSKNNKKFFSRIYLEEKKYFSYHIDINLEENLAFQLIIIILIRWSTENFDILKFQLSRLILTKCLNICFFFFRINLYIEFYREQNIDVCSFSILCMRSSYLEKLRDREREQIVYTKTSCTPYEHCRFCELKFSIRKYVIVVLREQDDGKRSRGDRHSADISIELHLSLGAYREFLHWQSWFNNKPSRIIWFTTLAVSLRETSNTGCAVSNVSY